MRPRERIAQPEFAAARSPARARRRQGRPRPGTIESRGPGSPGSRPRDRRAVHQHVVAGDGRPPRARCRGRCWHCPGDRCRRPARACAGGQRGRQIDRGRGLADSALLIGDGQDPGAGIGSRVHLAKPLILNMIPDGSAGFATRSTAIVHVCFARVNSSSTRRPLGKRQMPSGARKGAP